MGGTSRADVKRHRAVLKIIRRFSPTGRVLDLGTGEGHFAWKLKQAGYRVLAGDLAPAGRFIKQGQIPYLRLDLSRDLPLKDNSVDLVTALDVIEHLPDPGGFTRELNRLLRPGGVLILSLPNKLQVRSRVRFLLSGLYKGMKLPLEPYRAGPRQHITVLSYLELRYFLETAGFRLDRVWMSRLKAVSLPHFLLLALPITLYSAAVLALNPKVRDPRRRRYNRSVLKQLVSLPLLLSEDLLITAEKPADG